MQVDDSLINNIAREVGDEEENEEEEEEEVAENIQAGSKRKVRKSTVWQYGHLEADGVCVLFATVQYLVDLESKQLVVRSSCTSHREKESPRNRPLAFGII